MKTPEFWLVKDGEFIKNFWFLEINHIITIINLKLFCWFLKLILNGYTLRISMY